MWIVCTEHQSAQPMYTVHTHGCTRHLLTTYEYRRYSRAVIMDSVYWAPVSPARAHGLYLVSGRLKKACIGGCTLAQSLEYHWTVHVRWWCGLLSNDVDHLLALSLGCIACTTCIDAACCYQTSCVICPSVCRSVTLVSAAKMAQPIKMPFGLRTQVGPRNHVLDGVPYPP